MDFINKIATSFEADAEYGPIEAAVVNALEPVQKLTLDEMEELFNRGNGMHYFLKCKEFLGFQGEIATINCEGNEAEGIPPMPECTVRLWLHDFAKTPEDYTASEMAAYLTGRTEGNFALFEVAHRPKESDVVGASFALTEPATEELWKLAHCAWKMFHDAFPYSVYPNT